MPGNVPTTIVATVSDLVAAHLLAANERGPISEKEADSKSAALKRLLADLLLAQNLERPMAIMGSLRTSGD